ELLGADGPLSMPNRRASVPTITGEGGSLLTVSRGTFYFAAGNGPGFGRSKTAIAPPALPHPGAVARTYPQRAIGSRLSVSWVPVRGPWADHFHRAIQGAARLRRRRAGRVRSNPRGVVSDQAASGRPTHFPHSPKHPCSGKGFSRSARVGL